MTVKRVFLHIGHLKTGSSSIQNCLWDNRETLLSHGFCYLEAGLSKERKIGVRHYHLGQQQADFVQRWQSVRHEILNSTCENHIISYEGLIRLAPEQVAQIAAILSGFEVKVLCYLRRQDKFFQSLFAEYVQNHQIGSSFTDFAMRFHRLGCYHSLLQPWAVAFGSKQLCVFNFDQLVEQKCNVVGHFKSVVGINMGLAGEGERSNLSLGAGELVKVWQLNLTEMPENKRRKMLKSIVAESAKGTDKYSHFVEKDAANFVKGFKLENQRLYQSGLLSQRFDSNFYQLPLISQIELQWSGEESSTWAKVRAHFKAKLLTRYQALNQKIKQKLSKDDVN